jgi:hypothetical protein
VNYFPLQTLQCVELRTEGSEVSHSRVTTVANDMPNCSYAECASANASRRCGCMSSCELRKC